MLEACKPQVLTCYPLRSLDVMEMMQVFHKLQCQAPQVKPVSQMRYLWTPEKLVDIWSIMKTHAALIFQSLLNVLPQVARVVGSSQHSSKSTPYASLCNSRPWTQQQRIAGGRLACLHGLCSRAHHR
jgi:hypothetical protein